MRKFLVVFVVAITFEGTAWGQSQTAYKLRKGVDFVAGFWNADYLKDPSKDWCMPSAATKKISGALELTNDGLTFKPNTKGAQDCTIQYRNILGLSRGNAGSASALLPSLTIGSSLGSVLAGVLKSTVARTDASGKVTTTSATHGSLVWAGALAAGALISGILWYRSGMSANYVAISYDTKDTPSGCQGKSDPPASQITDGNNAGTIAQANQKSASQFHKGNVMIFRLKNRADYWETSMILSSATGCEFTSIAAENK